MRPSVGFAAVKLLEDAGCKVVVPSADLLRPAGLQFGRSRDDAGDRAPDDRRLRGLRLCRRAERLLRRHARQALSRTLRRRAGNGASRPNAFAAKCHELVSFLVDRLGVTQGCGALRRRGRLSRFLLGPARTRRREPAAQAARQRRGPAPRRAERGRRLLRLRRHVRRQIRRNIRRDRSPEERQYRGERRRHAARRRSRLPDEHGRQAAARGPRGEGASRRRSAGRHDRRAADRRSRVGSASDDRVAVTTTRISRTTSMTRCTTRACKARCCMRATSSASRAAAADAPARIRRAARQRARHQGPHARPSRSLSRGL